MSNKTFFLSVLWVFVIFNFVFFHNATKVSVTGLHNNLCEQSRNLNKSRILGANTVQARLASVWPDDAPYDPRPRLTSMTSSLLNANDQIYGSCVATEVVRDSQTLALDEMKKLADAKTNISWNRYEVVLQEALATLAGTPQ